MQKVALITGVTGQDGLAGSAIKTHSQFYLTDQKPNYVINQSY